MRNHDMQVRITGLFVENNRTYEFSKRLEHKGVRAFVEGGNQPRMIRS